QIPTFCLGQSDARQDEDRLVHAEEIAPGVTTFVKEDLNHASNSWAVRAWSRRWPPTDGMNKRHPCDRDASSSRHVSNSLARRSRNTLQIRGYRVFRAHFLEASGETRTPDRRFANAVGCLGRSR